MMFVPRFSWPIYDLVFSYYSFYLWPIIRGSITYTPNRKENCKTALNWSFILGSIAIYYNAYSPGNILCPIELWIGVRTTKVLHILRLYSCSSCSCSCSSFSVLLLPLLLLFLHLGYVHGLCLDFSKATFFINYNLSVLLLLCD